MASDEVPHLSFVIIERREHEQVHERRPVATVVENRFCDFLSGCDSIYHPPHAGIGRLRALEEATISANNVFATVLGDVVEFCNDCQCVISSSLSRRLLQLHATSHTFRRIHDRIVRQRRVRYAIHLRQTGYELAHNRRIVPCDLLDQRLGDELRQPVSDIGRQRILK